MIPKDIKETLGQQVRNELIKLNNQLLTGAENLTKTQYLERAKALIAQTGRIVDKKVIAYLKAEMLKAYFEGQARANQIAPKEMAVGKISPDMRVAQAKANSFYIQISERARETYQQIFKAINTEIKRSKEITTVKEVQSKIEERFKKQQIYKVAYENGRTMPLDAYAEMVARTGRTETFNRGAIDYARERTDLVKCTTIFPTCEICIKFQGRVYSVSGKSKIYPSLYDTALANGFEAIHPNCRHQFLPYFEDFESKEDLQKDRQTSNEPFVDDRTEKNRKSYQDWQALNARRREKKNEQLKTEQSD